VVASADVPPAVNQIHLNPFQHPRALVERCRELGVVVEAYSPLTHGRDLDDPAIADIARRLGRTPAQVLLRWCIQRGAQVIPKSTHRERIAENGDVFGFELSDDDMATLDALDETGGTTEAQERKWW
jgi:diketogulonate reductase-like aldo/keto reductase